MSLCFAGFILSVFLLVSPPSQGHDAALATAPLSQTHQEAYQAAISFLEVWLIQKNPNAALHKLAPEALCSNFLLSESCAGYIKDTDRGNAKAVTHSVGKFLREFTPKKNTDKVENLFSPLREPELRGETLNPQDIHKEKVFVFGTEITKDTFETPRIYEELQKTFPDSRLYGLFGTLNLTKGKEKIEVPLYLVIAQSPKGVKIASLGFYCQ